MTVQGIWYKRHHFNPKHKNEVIANYNPERPVRMTRSVTQNGPITMNAEKYEHLQKEGLGVDHQEWEKQKLLYRNSNGVKTEQ